jgi:hypothetical protein
VSVQYSAVKWNRNKRAYDCVLAAGIVLFLGLFFLVGKLAWPGSPGISDEVLLIRALGTCALLLLHVVLCIGPWPVSTPGSCRCSITVVTWALPLSWLACSTEPWPLVSTTPSAASTRWFRF